MIDFDDVVEDCLFSALQFLRMVKRFRAFNPEPIATAFRLDSGPAFDRLQLRAADFF